MMKLIFPFVIIFLFLIGCQNDNNPVSSKHEYSFTAKVGNEFWQGKSYLDFGANESQNLFLIPDDKYDYLRIKIKFQGEGEYQITDSNAVLVETVGGDVNVGTYYSISQQNILKIDYYDQIEGIIKGTFNLKIEKQKSIIEITDGVFKANFININ